MFRHALFHGVNKKSTPNYITNHIPLLWIEFVQRYVIVAVLSSISALLKGELSSCEVAASILFMVDINKMLASQVRPRGFAPPAADALPNKMIYTSSASKTVLSFIFGAWPSVYMGTRLRECRQTGFAHVGVIFTKELPRKMFSTAITELELLGAFGAVTSHVVFLPLLFHRYYYTISIMQCGNGNLRWEKVKPIMEQLPDNVFVIDK